MKKPAVMLLFSAALVGGYFLFARRASASTGDDAGGGFFDFFGELLGVGGSAGGAPGGLPFNEVTAGPLFPGGGSTPLPLGVPSGSPGSLNPRPSKTNPGAGLPVVPARNPGGTTLAPRPTPVPGAAPRPTPIPLPGRSTPIKPPVLQPTPRPAPRPTPIPVRQAQGTLGANNGPLGKDRRRAALL